MCILFRQGGKEKTNTVKVEATAGNSTSIPADPKRKQQNEETAPTSSKQDDGHQLLFERSLRKALFRTRETMETSSLAVPLYTRASKSLTAKTKNLRISLYIRVDNDLGKHWKGAKLVTVILPEIPARKVLSALVPYLEVEKTHIRTKG